MSISTQVPIGNLRWMRVAHSFLFIVVLSGMLILCFMNQTFEITRPSILAVAAIFGFFNFKNTGALFILQRVALVYMLELIFNFISDQCIQMNTALGNISISWAAVFVLLLFLVFVLGRQLARNVAGIEKEMLQSWAAVAGIISAFMVMLMFLLKHVYGYGFEHNDGVICKISLYFLVFFFAWEQLHNIWHQRIAAICFSIFFGFMAFGEV